MTNIRARIVRGIGYGAVAVSLLGYTVPSEIVSTPPSGGGGGYARQIIYKQPVDDAEEIFMMMVNAFMRTQ